MSDEKPFAEVSKDRDLFVDGACLYAGLVTQRNVGVINSAVAARERKAAAKALREAAESQIGHGEIVTMSAVRDALRSRAAALEGGAT